MNRGGGLFGTGDHDFLGAPMCARIPRLGTMRAWTNAQNVPPIGEPERLDTNRPFNALPCWVTQFVFDWLFEFQPKLREQFLDKYLAVPWPKRPFPPRPDPCLSCPHPEMFEIAVLGSMARSLADTLFGEGAGLQGGLERLEKLSIEQLDKQMLEAVGAGLAELQRQYKASFAETKRLFG